MNSFRLIFFHYICQWAFTDKQEKQTQGGLKFQLQWYKQHNVHGHDINEHKKSTILWDNRSEQSWRLSLPTFELSAFQKNEQK